MGRCRPHPVTCPCHLQVIGATTIASPASPPPSSAPAATSAGWCRPSTTREAATSAANGRSSQPGPGKLDIARTVIATACSVWPEGKLYRSSGGVPATMPPNAMVAYQETVAQSTHGREQAPYRCPPATAVETHAKGAFVRVCPAEECDRERTGQVGSPPFASPWCAACAGDAAITLPAHDNSVKTMIYTT
jgi:hypothetical protein